MSEPNEQPKPEQNEKTTKQEHVYDARVVIEQFIANDVFRKAVATDEFRNAVQYIAGVVAGCADMQAKGQVVRVSIVSDNGAIDFRYALRKAGPNLVTATPDMLSKLDQRKDR